MSSGRSFGAAMACLRGIRSRNPSRWPIDGRVSATRRAGRREPRPAPRRRRHPSRAPGRRSPRTRGPRPRRGPPRPRRRRSGGNVPPTDARARPPGLARGRRRARRRRAARACPRASSRTTRRRAAARAGRSSAIQSRRLWVTWPEPMTSTPSRVSGASARPTDRWCAVPRPGCTASWTTGTSWSGYMCSIGTHAPWSIPRQPSWPVAMPPALSRSTTRAATSGAPGAG